MGRILAVLTVAILLIGMLPSVPVDAQSPITILEQSLITDYKKSATFHLKVATSVGTITKVRLIWHFRGAASLNYGTTIFAPGQEVVAEYQWSMQNIPFIPWDYVYAKWDITDSAGNKFTTPFMPHQVKDSTRAWKELKTDNIAVYTYDQPDSVAQGIITTAKPVYDRMVKELGYTPTEPFVIVAYNNANDICTARVEGDCDPGRLKMQANYGLGIGFVPMQLDSDPTEFSSWLRASVATSMLYEWWTLPTSVNDVPTWLGNGIYFYYMPEGQAERTQRVHELAAQDQLLHLDQFGNAYEAAYVARDKSRLLDIFAMEASTVTFIVEKFGVDNLKKILTLMKSGKKTQAALNAVTGYDFATFEVAWSEWAGVKTPFVIVPTPTDSFTFPPTPTFPPKK